jgi:hypothetical protein
MRVSVVIGKVRSGNWEVLALPDQQIEAQKQLVKGLILSDGVLGDGRKARSFEEVLRFDSYTKRARFSGKPVKALAPAKLAPLDGPTV